MLLLRRLIAFLSEYRPLLPLAAVALFAELGYAVVNLSALPPFVKDDLGQGRYFGIVFGAFLVAETVLKSPMGVVSDRIGRKPLLVLGPLISACTAPLTAHLQNVFLLVGVRALDGVGAAMLWPAAFAIVGDRFPLHRQSAAMSLLNVTYLMGIAFGPLVGGLVADTFGSNRAQFYVASLLFALTAAISAFAIRHVPHEVEEPAGATTAEALEAAGSGAAHGATAITVAEAPSPVRAFWQNLRRIPDTLLLVLLVFFGVGLIAPVIKWYATDTLGLSQTEFGLILPIPAVLIGLASVPLGHAADRIGRVRAVRIGLGCCAVSMWFLILEQTYWGLILGACFIGLGFVLSFPAWMAHISATAAPNQRAAAIGAVATAQGIGMAIGGVLGPKLYSGWPLLGIPPTMVPFYGTAAVLSLALALSFWLMRPDRPAPAPGE